MMLIKANLAGDMRRLRAADGAPFAEVSAQVRSLFAGDQPDGATFAFGFIDEDGDNISIVTDADWQEAVGFFEGKAVRVTVTALQAAAPAAVPTAVPATAASFAAALCAPFNAAKAEADLAQAELADIAQAEDAQADPAEAAADASGGDEDADADTMANLKATLDEIAERVNAGDLTFIAAAQEVFAAGRAAVDAAITQCAETDVGRTIKDVYANVSELCEEQLAAFGQAVKERRERRQANGGRRGRGPCGRGRRGPGQFHGGWISGGPPPAAKGRGFGPGAARGLGLDLDQHPAGAGRHHGRRGMHGMHGMHSMHGVDHPHLHPHHGRGGHRANRRPAAAVPATEAGDVLPDGEISLGSHGPGVLQIKEALIKAFGFPDDYFRKNECFGRRVMSTIANFQADASLGEPTGVYNAAVKDALLALLAGQESAKASQAAAAAAAHATPTAADRDPEATVHTGARGGTYTLSPTGNRQYFGGSGYGARARAGADADEEYCVTGPTAPAVVRVPTAPAAATFPFETSPPDAPDAADAHPALGEDPAADALVAAVADGLFDVEAPPSPTTGRKWHQELTQLEEMGFGAEDVNLTLLDLHGGDVAQVVSTFLV